MLIYYNTIFIMKDIIISYNNKSYIYIFILFTFYTVFFVVLYFLKIIDCIGPL
jgi:hypothetical protein